MSVDDSSSATERRSAINQRHEQTANEVLPEHRELYIGGEWVQSASGETFETRDPTTGDTLASVQAGVAADIDRAVDAAWEAYDDVYSDYSTAERQAVLSEMADRVEEKREAFANLESLDNGKPITEARIDISLVIDHFRYFAGVARTRARPSRPTTAGRSRRTTNPTVWSVRSSRGTFRC